MRSKMVIFHQHHVEQAKAVIGAAACDDRGFFQSAKAGRCFSSVENFDPVISSGLHKLSGEGGDPGQALKKI